MKRRSPFVRIVGIGVICIIVAIPVLLFVATIPPGERVIKGILESQLSSQLHQQVSIGVFETNLLSRVQIFDLRIADARHERKTPALEVGAIKLEYALMPLLHRVLDVHLVEIDSLRINVERDRRDRFNVVLLDSALHARREREEKEDTAASSWKLQLGEFSLNDLRLDYHDAVLPAAATIDGLRVRAIRGREANSFDVLLDTGSGEIQYSKYPAADLNLRVKGMYSEAGIRLDSLMARTSGLLLTAEGDIPAKETGRMKANIHLTGVPQNVYAKLQKPLNLPPLKLEGNVAITAHVAGTPSAPEASLRMDLPEINMRHAGLSRGLIVARWKGDSLAVDTLQIRLFNGFLLGSAHIMIGDSMHGTGTIALRELSLASLYRTLRDTMSPYIGDINGDCSVLIAGKDPLGWSLTSGLTISRFAHLSDSLADIHFSATVQQREARFALDQDKIHLQAQLSLLQHDRLLGNYVLKVPDLAELGALVLQGEKLTGSMELGGDIGGTLRSPSATATIHGDKIEYRNFPVDRLDARLTYKAKQLYVSRAYLSGNLTVDPRDPPFGLDSARGMISYAGQAEGLLDTLRGHFIVNLVQPSYKGVRVDSARLDVTVSGKSISLSKLEIHRDTLLLSVQGAYNVDSGLGNLTANVHTGEGTYQTGKSEVPGGGRIEASFAMPAAKQMHVSATGRGLDLRAIASIMLDTARVSGLLDFQLKGGGTPSDPAGTFRLSLRQPQYDSLTLDSVTSSITLNKGRLDIHSFDIYGPHQRLTATAVAQMEKDSTGNYAFLETSKIEGKVRANHYDLHSAEAVLPKDAKLSGNASLDLRWNGTMQKPNPQGSFDLSDLYVLLNPKVGPMTLNLHGSIRGPAVHIDSASGMLLNQPFTLKGSVEARDWKHFRTDIGLSVADSAHLTAKGIVSSDRLDLTAEIQQLNLALAQPFLTSVTELSGILNSRVTFEGSMKNANTSGFLTISGLQFHPALVDSPFRDGTVRINFTGDAIRIDTVLVRSQYGTALVSGNLTLGESGVGTVNISTVIRNLPISSEDNFAARIDSAGVVFTGSPGGYVLGGDIILGESRFTKDVDITQFVGKQTVVRAAEQKPGLLQQTKLNLRIRGSDSLWVDNNLAKLRLHVELGILGTPSNPIPNGQVSIPEGEIYYLDRDFQVKQGTFLFSDPNKINPEIHLLANADVTSYQGMNASIYTVTFSAQGLLSELETDLSSTPPLDNSDIVALLTLGTTRSSMTQGGSGGGAGTVLEDRAEQLASQRLAGAISKKAAKAFGLDSVSVTGNLFNFNDSWGPQLVISKRVSRRTKITYSTNVGHINNQSFRLDYMLTKTLSLEGETDDRGDSTFSIIYGFEFP